MDINLYKEGLNNYINKQSSFSLATNSLKIIFMDHKLYYIWIDPDFSLINSNTKKVITTANDCPNHKQKNYKKLFEDWCGLFSDIRNSYFIKYKVDNNDFELFFNNGQSIYIPYNEDYNEPDLSYKHWYIKCGNVLYGDY